MSDTASRNPAGAPQFLADALLRSVSGAPAILRVSGPTAGGTQAELGIASTSFASIEISPVVMRRLRPSLKEGDQPAWELLVSATSVAQQITTLDLASAQALFAMTFAVSIAEQEYLIESVASNEAFGRIYLYRLLLREAQRPAI